MVKKLKNKFRVQDKEYGFDISGPDLRYGDMSFDDLRKYMDSIEKEFGEGVEKFIIEVDLYSDYGDYPAVDVNLYAYREETEAEARFRKSREDENQKRQLKHKRDQLERLKEELGES